MVSQNQALVEKFTRQGEQWVLTEYAGLEAALDLASVDCRIPLAEIYDKVDLDAASTLRNEAEEEDKRANRSA